jgi:hypothetical protein
VGKVLPRRLVRPYIPLLQLPKGRDARPGAHSPVREACIPYFPLNNRSKN